MANVTAKSIIDAIVENGSTQLKNALPETTRTSLAEVGKIVTTNPEVMNEFCSAIVEKIAFTAVNQKIFNNPLANLKKGSVPLGNAIEEIYINPPIDKGFDGDGTMLLKTETPDAKVAYYSMNRKGKYTVSISLPRLMTAFQSEQAFMAFINWAISSLYSGDNIGEFVLMKGALGKAVTNGKIKKEEYDDYKGQTNVKAIAKDIVNHSEFFTFPSTEYAPYNADVTEGETACETWCEKAKQILIIRADLATEIGMEYLANVFNLSKVEMPQRIIKVDNFGDNKDMLYFLADESSVQLYDYIYRTEQFHNGSNLTQNFYLHHWQTCAVSAFGDCVAGVLKTTAGTSSTSSK